MDDIRSDDELPNDHPVNDPRVTRHPVYFGEDEAEAECAQHGLMQKRNPVIKNDGHIIAAQTGVALYLCPECCIAAMEEQTDSDMDVVTARERMSNQFLRTNWSDIKSMFVDLGPGELDGDTIIFETETSSDELPDHIHDDGDWHVKD